MSVSGQLEVKNCKFTWKLKNFSKKCEKVADSIFSPIFKLEDANTFNWRLQLYPYGCDNSSQGYLSLYLKNKSHVNANVCFKVTLSDTNEIEIVSRTTQHNFEPQGAGFGWFKLIKRDMVLLDDGLFDDILNINCIIYMDMYSAEEVDMDKKILDDYESLFIDDRLSDLTITIGRQRIKAHKNILSARSNVFAAMFNHNMKEKNTNIIKITDVSYGIMNTMLNFIYSGNVTISMENAQNLLAAADKYEIAELIILCEKCLWKSIKIENACEILCVADLHNRNELKAKVMDYIITNIKQINQTPTFKDLFRSAPELYQKIVSELIDKKISS